VERVGRPFHAGGCLTVGYVTEEGIPIVVIVGRVSELRCISLETMEEADTPVGMVGIYHQGNKCLRINHCGSEDSI
jgi:hypothetical protein